MPDRVFRDALSSVYFGPKSRGGEPGGRESQPQIQGGRAPPETLKMPQKNFRLRRAPRSRGGEPGGENLSLRSRGRAPLRPSKCLLKISPAAGSQIQGGRARGRESQSQIQGESPPAPPLQGGGGRINTGPMYSLFLHFRFRMTNIHLCTLLV